MDPLDMTVAPHPRFPMQGHILTTNESIAYLTNMTELGNHTWKEMDYIYLFYLFYYTIHNSSQTWKKNCKKDKQNDKH
jgi:hypothetical protein